MMSVKSFFTLISESEAKQMEGIAVGGDGKIRMFILSTEEQGEVGPAGVD